MTKAEQLTNRYFQGKHNAGLRRKIIARLQANQPITPILHTVALTAAGKWAINQIETARTQAAHVSR